MGLSVNGGCEVTPLARQHRLAPGWSSCLAVCDWQIAAWEPGQAATQPGQTPTWIQAIQLISATISLTAILSQPPAPVQIYSPVFPLQTSGVEPSWKTSTLFPFLRQRRITDASSNRSTVQLECWIAHGAVCLFNSIDLHLIICITSVQQHVYLLWFDPLISCTEVDFGPCVDMNGFIFMNL